VTLIFLGSRGAQSAATLKTLLDQGLHPEAVLIEGEGGNPSLSGLAIPVIGSSNAAGLPEIAAAHGVPAFTVSRESLSRVLERLHPDRVLVSCYPYRIPESLLDASGLDWFNIHPSLLPVYRGPSPLFWQLRDGLDRIGVTLHRMSPELDMGPILAQRTFDLSGDFSMSSLSRQAGDIGALLYSEWCGHAPSDTPPGTRTGSRAGQLSIVSPCRRLQDRSGVAGAEGLQLHQGGQGVGTAVFRDGVGRPLPYHGRPFVA